MAKRKVEEPILTEDEVEDVEVNSTTMSSEERAIFNRVMSASDEWKESIQGFDMNDFSLAEDPFKLPKPAQRLRDAGEYAFRWITRDPKRLDEIMNKNRIARWYPVNSTAPTSDFRKFIDRNNGAVCREDQMLVFKRYDVFQMEQKMKHSLADAFTKSHDPLSKTGDEFSATKRRVIDGKASREEVKGDDIHFRGEAEVDKEAGVYTPNVSDNDLTVTN